MARKHAKVTWKVPTDVLADGIDRGERRFRHLLEEEMTIAADQMQQEVRGGGHRWHNRTGLAEERFTVTAERGGLQIVAAHGVFYGLYLEYRNGGQYGVIPDLMRYGAPIVQRGMQRAVDSAWT